MKYYAVTDDPNELMHYGILGMKWGVTHDKPRHTGSGKRRSSAYKKAQSKLGRMMKSGIKKAEAHWKTYNSPQAKEQRFMKKAMQQARNGTLKYGKLTDDQVRRVTDRLALERNARQLGSTENPRFSKRIKIAVGEGIVRGIGAGTGAYIEERFRGRGRSTAELKAQKRKEKFENKSSTQSRRARIKQKEEFYNTAYEEGMNPLDRRFYNSKERSKYLSEVKSSREQSDYAKNLQKIRDEQMARARGNYEGGRYFVERDSRRLKSTTQNTALSRLDAYNTAHERLNRSAEKELIRAERKQAAERRRTADLAVTSTRRRRRKGRS